MISNLPPFFDMIYVTDDGKLSTSGKLYNDQMFQSLNLLLFLVNNLTTTTTDVNNPTGGLIINGLNPPSKTTAEIVAIEPSCIVGTIWYNSDLKKLQFKADAGIIETITST